MMVFCSNSEQAQLGGVLYIHWVAYLFAVAAGMVSSGAIGTLWAMATDEEPSLGPLATTDLRTPIRAIAFVFCAPTTLMVNSTYELFRRPLWGLVLLIAGLALSFMQGVVLLTQVFGVT